jgi:hypothetical protein
VLSRHRTRTAAVYNWGTLHTSIEGKIIRRDSRGIEKVIVEGTWHEAARCAT